MNSILLVWVIKHFKIIMILSIENAINQRNILNHGFPLKTIFSEEIVNCCNVIISTFLLNSFRLHVIW